MIDLFTAQTGRICNVCSGYALSHLIFRIKIKQVYHALGKFGIKLCTATLDQFLSHNMLWDCITITPVRCHSVIGICHSDDPRDLGDGFALKPFGVASSVVALVVIARTDREPRGFLDDGQYLTALNGVLLDLLEFASTGR